MKKNINIQFRLAFEGKPDKGVEVTAYAFDQRGRLLAREPVKEGKASIKVSEDQAKRLLLFFAPEAEGKRPERPTLELMARLRAYAPSWKYDPKKTDYQLPSIPDYHWKWWLWCKCRVRGQVVRPVTHAGTTTDMPVCYARVHVCEVDPIWLIIRRLPDDLIWRLRDEFLHIIATPKVPPIPPPPEPDGLAQFRYDSGVIDATPVRVAQMNWLNPQPEPPSPFMNLSRITEMRAISPVPEPPSDPSYAMKYDLPSTTKAQLSSGSLPTVKESLLANADLIRSYLCYWPWIWPYLYKCDELALLYTDAQGRFDTDIWYLCAADHPDLYFWVDY